MSTRKIMLAAMAAAALSVTVPGIAAAATGHGARPLTADDATTTHAVAGANANAERVVRYWTPARMKAAIPVSGAPVSRSAARSLTSRAPRSRPDAPVTLTRPRKRSGPGARPLNLTTSPGQGKVFFTDPANGLNYVCSGGAINNPAKDMVFTAGHCVNTGSGTWMTNWLYVPAYYYGKTPYGKYPAHYLTSFNGWILGGNLDYDVGVVNVYPYMGVKLVNYTGGNGLEYNAGTPKVTIWGYPAAPPYNGEQAYYCQNVATSTYGSRIKAGCAMTAGASGGPWLTGYNTKIYLGTDDAVTSTNVPGLKGYIASPYFGSDIGTIYKATENK